MNHIKSGVIALGLGLALAVTGTAFTPATIQDVYVQTSQGYQLKTLVEDEGECITSPSLHCEFIKNSNNQFVPAPGDMNRVWNEY